MNSINFNKNDFPLTTGVLDFMQSTVWTLEKLTGLVGGNYIVSGCELVGTNTQEGYVVVNGELMYFTGGQNLTYVRVVSQETTITIQDANYTKTVKTLVAGAGTGQILWSTFRRATDLLTMIESKSPYGVALNTSGSNVKDYYSQNLPARVTEFNYNSIIPSTARFAVLWLKYKFVYGSTAFRFYIRASSDTTKQNIELMAQYNQDTYNCIVIPVNNGKFWVESPDNVVYSALKIFTTLVAYF